MNDKQQLAAMGEHLTDKAGQAQPLCMAKRVEELEGQVNRAERALIRSGFTYTKGAEEWKPPLGPYARPFIEKIDAIEERVRVMAELLRKTRPFVELEFCSAMECSDSEGDIGYLLCCVDDALSGKLPNHVEQPLAMVPGGDGSRDLFERWFRRDYHPDRQGPHIKDIAWAAWQAALAAAPKPEAK